MLSSMFPHKEPLSKCGSPNFMSLFKYIYEKKLLFHILSKQLFCFLIRCFLIFSLEDPLSEEDNDHEEEFYYTELEIPLFETSTLKRQSNNNNKGTPTMLSDHMDMARPPHENPEYYRPRSASASIPYCSTTPHHRIAVHSGLPQQMYNPTAANSRSALPIAIPISNFSFTTTGVCPTRPATASAPSSNLATVSA